VLKYNFAIYLAEYLTGVFIFMGAGAMIAAKQSGGLDNAAIGLAIAAVHGGTIGFLVATLGNVSGGHFNPIATWAGALRDILMKDLGFAKGAKYAGYIVAQLAGAVSGAILLHVVFQMIDGGEAAAKAVNYGTPALAGGVSIWAGFFLEMAFGFILAFVILRKAMEEGSPWAPFWIGGTIFILAASPLGSYTGAAMNPARHFGPALISGYWDNWWVYAFAPVVGATFAVVINDIMSRRKSPSPV